MTLYVPAGARYGVFQSPTADALRIVSSEQVDFCQHREERLAESYPTSDLQTAQRTFEEIVRQNSLLDLFLLAVDRSLSQGLRSEAVQYLNSELVEHTSSELLEAVTFSTTIPEDCDLTGTLLLCDYLRCPQLARVLNDLTEHEEAINRVANAWNSYPASYDRRADLQTAFIRRGTFAQLARALQSGTSADEFLFQSLSDRLLIAKQEVNDALRFLASLLSSSTRRAPNQAELPEPDPLPGSHVLASNEAYQRVRRQKSAIAEALRRNDDHRAGLFLRDLVEFQQHDPDRLAKSLCDLATSAHQCHNRPMQLDLLELANDIAPFDLWAQLQYADALSGAGYLEAALKLYDSTVTRGGDSLALVNRAHVLRKMRRFPQALSAYTSAIEAGAYELRCQTGIAQTHKDMGDLVGALTMFKSLKSSYPGSIDPVSGEIEVLRSMNRLAEAGQLSEALLVSTSDSYVQTSYAATLSSLSRPNEAIVLYNALLADDPGNEVAIAGKSAALQQLGHIRSAETLLTGAVERAPWSRALVEALGSLFVWESRLSEAVTLYTSGDERLTQPWRKRGYAEVLRRLGRWSESRQLFEELLEQEDDPANRLGLANTFLPTAGIPDALDALNEGLNRFPGDRYLRLRRSQLLLRQGSIHEAIEDSDVLLAQSAYDVDATSMKAHGLSRLAKLEEAELILRSLVDTAPRDARAHVALGAFLKRANRAGEALVLFDQARRLRPGSREALRGWVASSIVLERTDDLLLPSDLDEGFASHLRGLVALAAGGDIETAVRLLRQPRLLTGAGPENEVARAAFALALLRSGRAEEAIPVLDLQFAESGLENVADVLLLHAAGEAGDTVQAEAVFGRLAFNHNLSPQETELVEELAERYLRSRRGRLSNARLFEIECQYLAATA